MMIFIYGASRRFFVLRTISNEHIDPCAFKHFVRIVSLRYQHTLIRILRYKSCWSCSSLTRFWIGGGIVISFTPSSFGKSPRCLLLFLVPKLEGNKSTFVADKRERRSVNKESKYSLFAIWYSWLISFCSKLSWIWNSLETEEENNFKVQDFLALWSCFFFRFQILHETMSWRFA